MKVRLTQLEVDKLVKALLNTMTIGDQELNQRQVDELVEALLETFTLERSNSKLLDDPVIYDYFALKLKKENKRTMKIG